MNCIRIAALGLAIAAGSSTPAWAAVCMWTGADANNNWSRAQNWSNCLNRAPQSGDAVVFPSGSPHALNRNDIAGLSLAGIQINGAATGGLDYELVGEPITLTGSILVNAPGVAGVRIRNRLTAARPIVFANVHPAAAPLIFDVVELGGAELTFNAVKTIFVEAISGQGSVAKLGTSLLVIEGASTYTGLTRVREGGLFVSDALSLGASGADDGTVVENGAFVELFGVVSVPEPFTITGGGTAGLGALRVDVAASMATLTGDILLGETAIVGTLGGARLVLAGTVTPIAAASQLFKVGNGSLTLQGSGNRWSGLVLLGGSVLLDGTDVLPDAADVLLSANTVLDLQGRNETIGFLNGPTGAHILLSGATLSINQNGQSRFAGTVEGTGNIVKLGAGQLELSGPAANTYTGTAMVQAGTLVLDKTAGLDALTGPVIVNGGTLRSSGRDQIADTAPVTINGPGVWELRDRDTIGSLAGSGAILFPADSPNKTGGLTVGSINTSTTFSGTIEGDSRQPSIVKVGSGSLALTGGGNFAPAARIEQGTLIMDGNFDPAASILVDGGRLTGSGRVGQITGSGGAAVGVVAPSAAAPLSGASAVIGGQFEVNLTGAGHSQLRLTDGLTLRPGAELRTNRSTTPEKGAKFIIVSAGRATTGTFAGLPQGAELSIEGQKFTIDYSGSNGHEIVLTALEGPPSLTYFLAEGSTGPFFDEDVLLANPNPVEAPVTLTFLKDNGEQVVVSRLLAPQSHHVVHVDQIPGLEGATASVQVVSTAGRELFVERTMFWGPSRYAGHTGSAVREASNNWFFAEGAQGFFDTFVLLINPNPAPIEVTLTFLLANGPPVVKTVTVDASSRRTVGAHEYPELADRTFGINVEATQPIMAERAMYFASTPGRLWGGGHESPGIPSTSSRWFLAEGATGTFFDTFVLLSNPQTTPAQVTVTYLLSTGEAIALPKTIPANGRLTLNPEAEADERLKDATLSTDVASDVPIIVERSMYWPGATLPWGESHNSVAFTEPGLMWGLAEGRVGGDATPFSTYILLANPGTTPAQVEATFLRDEGSPIVRTYTVPATGRFTIDCSTIPELVDTTFGAAIAVTNGVPIVVERSMYWDANGIFWSGGTNGPGLPWGPS